MIAIKNKVLFFLLLPMLVIGVCYFLITNFIMKKAFDDYIEQESLSNTNRLGELIKDDFINKNEAKLVYSIFNEKEFGFHVRYISIFNNEGNQIANTFLNNINLENVGGEYVKKLQLPKLFYSIVNDEKIFIVDRPINIGLYNIGMLRVGYDFSAIEQRFMYIFYIYLFLGVAFLVIVAVLSPILSRFLTNPIEELTKRMNDFSKGDYTNKLGDGANNDEVGRLSFAFHQMAENIYNSKKQFEKEKQDILAKAKEIEAMEGSFSKTKKQLEAEKKEIQKKTEELDAWQAVVSDRELKMIELKRKIKELEDKLNK